MTAVAWGMGIVFVGLIANVLVAIENVRNANINARHARQNVTNAEYNLRVGQNVLRNAKTLEAIISESSDPWDRP